MKERVQHKLLQLRQELDKGNLHLQQLESQAHELRQTLLRISGAIRVLEELQEEAAAAVETDNAISLRHVS